MKTSRARYCWGCNMLPVQSVVLKKRCTAYTSASDDVWLSPKYNASFIQICIDGRARQINEKA